MANNIITSVVGITDAGLVRTNNEDAFFIADPDTGQKYPNNTTITQSLHNNRLLLIVSDGMGGYEGGEIASRLTVRTIKSELPRLSKRLSPQSRLEAAIEEANSVVWNKKKGDHLRHSMGATVTSVLIEKNIAYIGVVGDSRAYVLRDERIKQLTTDQTIVQVLIDSGALTPETAALSQHKNVLLQSIGGQEYLQIAVSTFRVINNDILLLCSDGLHGKISNEEIRELLASSQPLQKVGEALIAAAKDRGGDDNITVVLARFEGEGLKVASSMRSITDSMDVISRFDPEVAPQPKPKRQGRPATYKDLVTSAVVERFAENNEQREELAKLGEYGEFLAYRKGDKLVEQGEMPDDGHYWLLSGRFRVEIEGGGQRQTVAFIVPPTDERPDEYIVNDLEGVRVKRQFFTASLGMLSGLPRTATIWCEDDTNIVIRMPQPVYQRIAAILGEKFQTAVRHS